MMVSTARQLNASTRDASEMLFSIVIPVYNSVEILPTTITRVVAAMEAQGWRFELVLVNDGSSDGSWEIVREAAETDSRIIGVDLIKNYGQHNANLCGLRHTAGDYVITMDDDLQNPPEEIEHLVAEALQGHDVVFGRFDRKKAAWHRSLGSKAIGSINRRVFAQPPSLTVSNFRILDRRVVDRICQARTAFPYITGQALLYSSHPSNADVRHDARSIGSSHYNLVRIVSLVLRILFSYSVSPLRIVAGIGAAIALASLAFGTVVGVRGVVSGTGVEGWTSTVTLLSLLNGTMILMLAMIGEYVVRTLQQVSDSQSYHVKDVVNAEDPA